MPRLTELPPPAGSATGFPWTSETDSALYSARAHWPRISIVTPSYNQAAYVEETIRSVLLQNYPNLQYIVVDGGSTDGSVGIIEKYSRWLDHWESAPDRGQSHAINKGLARCDGEWFNWLNSDDCFLPGALAEIGRQETNAAIVSAGELTGETLQSPRPLGRTKFASTLEETVVEHFICQQGLFFRTDLVKSLGGVREELSCVMDLDLLARALLRGGLASVAEIPATVAFFRQHVAAKTVTLNARFKQEERALFHSLARALDLDPRLVARLAGSTPALTAADDVQRLNPVRLSRALATRCWWNGVVEPAWQARDFPRFKREAAQFFAAFPSHTGGRFDALKRWARLPAGVLKAVSLFRKAPPIVAVA